MRDIIISICIVITIIASALTYDYKNKLSELEENLELEQVLTDQRFDAAINLFEMMGSGIIDNANEIDFIIDLMDYNTEIYNAKFRALGF